MFTNITSPITFITKYIGNYCWRDSYVLCYSLQNVKVSSWRFPTAGNTSIRLSHKICRNLLLFWFSSSIMHNKNSLYIRSNEYCWRGFFWFIFIGFWNFLRGCKEPQNERHRISTFTSTTFIYITEDKYEIEIISSHKTLSILLRSNDRKKWYVHV